MGVKFLTLLTDFGLKDGYTGVMKGVIYRITPDAQIADITHSIRPQDVFEGGLVWSRSCPYFPDNTVHIGVVDPGVGTQRRPIAARLGRHLFVCPDNGLITPLLEQAEQAGDEVKIVHLDQPRFWLPDISSVFHGRDIFSPVGAALANGVSLEEVGSAISDPVRRSPPRTEKLNNGWQGEIVSIDHFGNATANIDRQQLQGLRNIRVRAAGREINGLVHTFGEREPGTLVAFIDSDDRLAIAIVQGSAAQEIGIKVGDRIEVVAEA
jgi:S-adenosyl-L-methionine hydrolase (adenosine-forming)